MLRVSGTLYKTTGNISNSKWNRMNRVLAIISLATLVVSCASTTKKTNHMEDQKNQTNNAPVDTTPKVTGIGGIFFFSENLQETRAWYAKNLGFEINDWGSSGFESRDINNPDEVNTLQWSPFKKGDAYFSPSKKDFMIVNNSP